MALPIYAAMITEGERIFRPFQLAPHVSTPRGRLGDRGVIGMEGPKVAGIFRDGEMVSGSVGAGSKCAWIGVLIGSFCLVGSYAPRLSFLYGTVDNQICSR